MAGVVAGGLFNAVAFAGAGFLFSKLNHHGYEAEVKRHDKAKEKWYENRIKKKDEIEQLRRRLSEANVDINAAAGIPIVEFIGLRSKMYSYIKNDGSGGKTAKGVSKRVVKRSITHNDYRNVLLGRNQMRHKMKTIRSDHHVVGSYDICKTSLSCFDDKRFILDDGITSYAYGHYRIDESSEESDSESDSETSGSSNDTSEK